MNTSHIVGMVIAIGLIAGLAIYSGMSVKKGDGKTGSGVIMGLIMGTLVGGSSTVGTAQLAYNYGMSAWWFTLGGGIGCLVLALFYCVPLRRQNCATLVGAIRQEYGPAAGLAASVLNSVGTFINIISQLLAASAVVLVVWPALGNLWTVVISAVFMALYVVFGGAKGAGMVGTLKMILLYLSMVVCGILALRQFGGLGSLFSQVQALSAETGVPYFSLFAQGVGTDLGSGISLVLGVLTTQVYAQAVLSGRSDAAARRGALLSGFLIPPIGVCGIVVGLFMRTVTDPTVFVAKTALTSFVLTYLPPLAGGLVLGTLFIASIGTGAGLALGIATIVNRDIVQRFTSRFADARRSERLSKLLIVAVLALGCAMSTGSLGDMILSFGFMSMGLRGAVVFVPLCCALWAKGKIQPGFALASILAGPILVLLFGTVLSGVLPFDSLFAGIIACIVIMGIGLAKGGRHGPVISEEESALG